MGSTCGRPQTKLQRSLASNGIAVLLLILADRKQLRAGHNKEHAIRGHHGSLDLRSDLHLAEQLLLFAMRENLYLAVVGAQVDFPIHPVGGTPDTRLEVFLPALRPRVGIEAVQ